MTTATNNELIGLLRSFLFILLSTLSNAQRFHKSQRRNPKLGIAFTERFKYDVISSSLLSLTLSAPALPSPSKPQSRHDLDPNNPTQLQHNDHRALGGRHSTSHSKPNSITYTLVITISLIIVLAGAGIVGAGYLIPVLLTLAVTLVATLFFFYEDWCHVPVECQEEGEDVEQEDIQSRTLQALHDLISAGSAWDAVVHEAIVILESDRPERSTYPLSPTLSPSLSTSPNSNSHFQIASPTSPHPSLRTAFHSTLHTTHTQCDTLRTLLAALAQPGEEVGRLAGMYAPPSPSLSPSHSFASGYNTPASQRSIRGSSEPWHPNRYSPRPLSLPAVPSHRSMLLPSPSSALAPSLENKRATWNGSYSAQARAGADRRCQSETQSERATPFNTDEKEEDTPFGTAALSLHRKRRSDGLSIFGFSLPSMPRVPTHSHSRPPSTTFASASRFTTRGALAHLHCSNSHHSHHHYHEALRGALAARRYACAHLLALRFGDENEEMDRVESTQEGEGEAYWEDVRSVMGLLTSTLGDAASRLAEALRDAEDRKQREVDSEDEEVNKEVGLRNEGDNRLRESDVRSFDGAHKPWRNMAQMIIPPSSPSFAPMPSHIARFAAHVDVISSAMNSARDNLERCVRSLRGEEVKEALADNNRTGSNGRESVLIHRPLGEDGALIAYERLRRELGLALRECERGRERLLDCIAAANPLPAVDDDDDDDVPGLRHDAGSDESDKHDSRYSPVPDFDTSGTGTGSVEDDLAVVVSGDDNNNTEEAIDDATAHLLRMASSRHLPPQGIEQVFEAEPDPVVTFTRERSKLTREERIRTMKARRESGVTTFKPSDSQRKSKPTQETWGPGVDVVQELKDVIWQVGERRRKLAEGAL